MSTLTLKDLRELASETGLSAFPMKNGGYDIFRNGESIEHCSNLKELETAINSYQNTKGQSASKRTTTPSLPGSNPSSIHEDIEKFISELPPSHPPDLPVRVISTVLFTDIVGSTEQQREVGDRIWTERISKFETNTTEIVERCRGRVVRLTGDGVKAAFEVPGDGLRAARLLVEDANKLGHPIRVGLHTGEVQWSDSDMHGMAVNIASRVADQAGAGEVLTTTVTQGIVEGGDYTFENWGEVDLKGIGVRTLVRLKHD